MPDGTVNDLQVGDTLHTLGGVVFAHAIDASADPVLVCDVTHGIHLHDGDTAAPAAGSSADAPPADNAEELISRVTTSAGTLYALPTTSARHHREDTVTPSTILLISRRTSLHAHLLHYGVPIVRRSPVADDRVPQVSARDWGVAPLVVIDAHLAPSTLRGLFTRPNLPRNENYFLVADNLDDARPYERANLLSTVVAFIPYDRDALTATFRARTGRPSTTLDVDLIAMGTQERRR